MFPYYLPLHAVSLQIIDRNNSNIFVNNSILNYTKIQYLDDCNGGVELKIRHLSLLPLNRKIDEKSDFIPF